MPIDSLEIAMPQVIGVSEFIQKLEFLQANDTHIKSKTSQIFSGKSDTLSCFLTVAISHASDVSTDDDNLNEINVKINYLHEKIMLLVSEKLQRAE